MLVLESLNNVVNNHGKFPNKSFSSISFLEIISAQLISPLGYFLTSPNLDIRTLLYHLFQSLLHASTDKFELQQVIRVAIEEWVTNPFNQTSDYFMIGKLLCSISSISPIAELGVSIPFLIYIEVCTLS